jgi:hypothetical protein
VLQKKVTSLVMAPIAEALKKNIQTRKIIGKNELKSLDIEPRRQNELNDKEEKELQALAESIKVVYYYQDYKTAYSNNNNS